MASPKPTPLSETPVPSEQAYLDSLGPYLSGISTSTSPASPGCPSTSEHPYSVEIKLPPSDIIPRILMVDKSLTTSSAFTVTSDGEALRIVVTATSAKQLRTASRGLLDSYCVAVRGIVEFGGGAGGAGGGEEAGGGEKEQMKEMSLA